MAYRRAIPAAGFAGALLALPLNAEFRAYPGLIDACIEGIPAPGDLSFGMGVGISGLPEGRADAVREFRDVTSRLAKLHSSGYRVAVLDPHEAIYCLASGVPPCDRYCPLLGLLIFKDQLDQALSRFEYQKFDYVMTHDIVDIYRVTPDIVGEFLKVLLRDYSPMEMYGRHRIWERQRGKGTNAEKGW